MIKALIFDCDGLILDTETPEFTARQNIYQEHGYEFPAERWAAIVGGSGHVDFDAAEHLSVLVEGRLDAAFLRDRFILQSKALIHSLELQPGVMDYLIEAKRHYYVVFRFLILSRDGIMSNNLPFFQKWVCTLLNQPQDAECGNGRAKASYFGH